MKIGNYEISIPQSEPDTTSEYFEEDDEDREDFNIRSTDNLILAGHVEGDSSSLEVREETDFIF